MIAGGGFAMMAWRLAQVRVHGGVGYPELCPARLDERPVTAREFYRILDHAHRDVTEFLKRYGWVYPVVKL